MNYILVLLFSFSVFAQDKKISQLTLGTGSAVGVNDSFPYVDSTAGATKRLKISDLKTVPALATFFAPLASPTFTGTVTGTFSGSVTGTASGNTTYTANNHGMVVSSSTNTMTVVAPDASTTKVWTSGGLFADPSWQPASSQIQSASYYMSAGGSYADQTTIVFNTLVWDDFGGSEFNTSTGTFTAPATGKYRFTMTMQFSNISFTSTGASWGWASVNGVQFQRFGTGTGVVTGNQYILTISGSVILSLNLNDTATFAVQITQTPMTSLGGQKFTWLQFERIK